MFTQMGLEWVINSLFSMAGMLLRGIGVPGVVVLVAGGLLVMSLSSAVKSWLKTKRGMTVMAAVVAAAMVLAWFTSPKNGWASLAHRSGNLASRSATDKSAKKAKAQGLIARGNGYAPGGPMAGGGQWAGGSGGGIPLTVAGGPGYRVGSPGVAFERQASFHGEAGGSRETMIINGSGRPVAASETEAVHTGIPAALVVSGPAAQGNPPTAKATTTAGTPSNQTQATPGQPQSAPSSPNLAGKAATTPTPSKAAAASTPGNPPAAQPSPASARGTTATAQPTQPGGAVKAEPTKIFGKMSDYRLRHPELGNGQGSGTPGQQPASQPRPPGQATGTPPGSRGGQGPAMANRSPSPQQPAQPGGGQRLGKSPTQLAKDAARGSYVRIGDAEVGSYMRQIMPGMGGQPAVGPHMGGMGHNQQHGAGQQHHPAHRER